jgi:hypothetical protein
MIPPKPRQKFITHATYEQWVRQCKGKYKHLSFEFAEKHRAKIAAKEGGDARFNNYQCPFCTRWHVGHDRRNIGLTSAAPQVNSSDAGSQLIDTGAVVQSVELGRSMEGQNDGEPAQPQNQ